MLMQTQYVPFESKQARPPGTFLYPADWSAEEVAEDGVREVIIRGPANREETHHVTMLVVALSATHQTLDETVQKFMSTQSAAPEFHEVSSTASWVSGSPAVEIEIEFSLHLPLQATHPRLTRIRERHIFIQREDQLYELVYTASEEEYGGWLDCFLTLVQTFKPE